MTEGHTHNLSLTTECLKANNENWPKNSLVNEWVQLMVRAIFCGYHQQAVDNLKNGIMKINSNNIDIYYTEGKFRESLFNTDSGFEDIRTFYINDIKP